MRPGKAKTKRCAIYTRKSSEEGLEQEFNSLDAQWDACTAYIASQAGEGWRPINQRYDDGGFSGGNIERPALLRLLADIDRGLVDVVVVYKVDRLTRSLTDFVKIIERLDARSASFVSVTQSFNTTTSMGRLTLNVLLSFAQFEREVTGERIRDKIAASKAKGLWMGGRPPLGYDPIGRTLEINQVEAETVRGIFARYLELNSVHALMADLAARGVVSKSWITRDGRRIEGAPFARGALYYLLRNRLYLGEILHRRKPYPGRHPAILDATIFDAVQASLDAKAGVRRDRPIRPGGSPLTGILFDSAGDPMSPSATRGRSGQPHRYYVSKAALTGRKSEAGSVRRIAASAIEDLVRDRVGRLLGALKEWDWAEARQVLMRVVVLETEVVLTLARPAGKLGDCEGCRITLEEEVIQLSVPVSLQRRNGRTELIDGDREAPDDHLIEAVARAHVWRTRLASGKIASITALARDERWTDGPVFHRLPLAYLSPEVTNAILSGRYRRELNLEQLVRGGFPMSWAAQKRLFGLDARR